MNTLHIRRSLVAVATCSLLSMTLSARAQDEEKHGAQYKAPPETCHITIQVLKGFNDKPIANAAIIFHPVKDGKDQGNMEIKSDPDGKAVLDVIAVGSTVQVQVIARGFATYGETFTLKDNSKDFVIKMLPPKEQMSVYQDNSGKTAVTKAGVQEPAKSSNAVPPIPPPPPKVEK